MRLVSDVEQSSLQLVEMCSEGVWSPVCDYNWTVADATVVCREFGMSTGIILENATALGSLIWPRAVTRCNLAVSDMYMCDFGKTHQIAYTYCSVGISDLKPLTGTSADQLPHRKSRSLATA